MATDEMIQWVSKFETLKELRITNCTYITGEFLNTLRARKLQTLNFKRSYQIQFDEILQCVKNNKDTLTNISLDGENVKSVQIIEMVQNVVNNFEEFGFYFGEKLKDLFLVELAKKVSSKSLKKLVIRKAFKLTNNAFELFFSKQLHSLTHLNLDEC